MKKSNRRNKRINLYIIVKYSSQSLLGLLKPQMIPYTSVAVLRSVELTRSLSRRIARSSESIEGGCIALLTNSLILPSFRSCTNKFQYHYFTSSKASLIHLRQFGGS